MRTDREIILEIFERIEGLHIIEEREDYIEFDNNFTRESLSLEFNDNGSLRCFY